MKKSIQLFLIATGAFLLVAGDVETDVFICKGSASKKYHLVKDCRGLDRCSTPIYKVKISEARDLGRTLCGWED